MVARKRVPGGTLSARVKASLLLVKAEKCSKYLITLACLLGWVGPTNNSHQLVLFTPGSDLYGNNIKHEIKSKMKCERCEMCAIEGDGIW